jgi:hypothetical protein
MISPCANPPQSKSGEFEKMVVRGPLVRQL